MSGRLYCLASTESNSCVSSVASASAISVFTRLSDKSVKLVLPTLPVARVARDRQAAGVPLVCGQGQLRGEALRLHQRLVVDHDELALVRPAVRSRKTLAL